MMAADERSPLMSGSEKTPLLISPIAADKVIDKPHGLSLLELLMTPLLCLGSLIMIVVIAPGTAKTGSDLIFTNPTLDIFSCVAQVLFFIWAFSVGTVVFNVCPRIPDETLFPGISHYRKYIHRISFQGSVLFFILTCIFIFVFDKKPRAGTSEVVHVPFAPVIGELFIFIVCFFFLLCPWTPGWRMRKDFFRTLAECLISVFGKPFLTDGRVEFKHVLLTDAMTSATVFLWELAFSACHFINSDYHDTHVTEETKSTTFPCQKQTLLYGQPVLFLLPYWLRMVQCFWQYREACNKGERGWARYNQLVNLGKYFFSLAAIMLTSGTKIWDHFHPDDKPPHFWSGWRAVILVVIAVRTVYAVSWDFAMDWLLCQRDTKHPFLRANLLYDFVPGYYIAMVINFVLRCTWVATLQTDWCYAGCSLLFAFLEILRRGIWFFFRVEIQALKVQPPPKPINSDFLS